MKRLKQTFERQENVILTKLPIFRQHEMSKWLQRLQDVLVLKVKQGDTGGDWESGTAFVAGQV